MLQLIIVIEFDRGHYSWLQHDRPVLDHEFPKKNVPLPAVHNNNHGNNKCALALYFLVK